MRTTTFYERTALENFAAKAKIFNFKRSKVHCFAHCILVLRLLLDFDTCTSNNQILFCFLSSDEGITQNRGVLIHCLAGVSRSVTVTIAYLISALNMTLNEAYDFVKQRKPSVNPNLNFMGQLLEFERQLRTPQTPSSTTSTLSSDSSLDGEVGDVDLNIVPPRCQTV